MAPEMIQHEHNGMIVDIDNLTQFTESFYRLSQNDEIKNSMIKNGFNTVKAYDYPVLSEAYKEKIYLPLLKTKI